MASREGFNLFHKYGKRNFFRRGILGDKWARRYVLRDTFGRYVCQLIGHTAKTYKAEDSKLICFRCFQEVR